MGQGPPGEKGEQGIQGIQGPPGVSDPDEVVNKLKNDSKFMNSLSTNIAKNSTELGTSVASSIGTSDTIRNQIVSSLQSKKEFLNAVADKLTSDSIYKERIIGPPGTIADDESIKLTFEKKSLWCADGELCTIPTKKWDGSTNRSPGDPSKVGELGIQIPATGRIHTPGRLHMSGDEFLYILNKSGAIVGKEWGGTGNLSVQGKLTVGEKLHTPPGANLCNSDGTICVDVSDIKNTINNTTKLMNNRPINKAQDAGFVGPLKLIAYGHGNKCWDVGQNNGLGIHDCMDGNKYQTFWYSPVTGQLYSEQLDKCLDNTDNEITWNTCNNHENQSFQKENHVLRWGNGRCVDVNSNIRKYTCDPNNPNQKVRFGYVGQF